MDIYLDAYPIKLRALARRYHGGTLVNVNFKSPMGTLNVDGHKQIIVSGSLNATVGCPFCE